MLKRRVFIFVTTLALFLMMGCSMININYYPSQEEVEAEVEPAPEANEQFVMPTKGGELTIPICQPDSLNPLFTESKEMASFLGLIYEGMFAYDQELQLIPMLVDSWDVLEDGKQWEFHLREGIKWHNGNELTGEDVKFTFDLLLNTAQVESQKMTWHYAGLMKHADIISMELKENHPYTVVLMLDKPMEGRVRDMLTFPILPKEVYQHGDLLLDQDNNIDINLLIGTGPYKVEFINSNIETQINLVRNNQWWDNEPYIDTIVARIYEDQEQVQAAFKDGEIDLFNTSVIYAEVFAREKGSQMHRYLTQSYDFIGINFKQLGPLQEKEVRQAMAYALDRKDIISRVYFNNAQAVDVPIPPNSWLYDPNVRVFDYQPLKAKQLLREAGWQDSDDDGILDRGSEEEKVDLKFTMTAYMDNNMRKEALNIIVEQLQAIGMDVEIRLLSLEDYTIALEQGDFEAILTGYYLDLSCNLSFALHSSQMGEGLNNFIGYSNEELDSLLDRANQTDDQRELEITYKEIQKHLISELPIISLYYQTSSLITKDRVKGIEWPTDMQIYHDIEEWYLAK